MQRRSFWILNLSLGGINLLIAGGSLFFPMLGGDPAVSSWRIAAVVMGLALGWLSLTAFVRRLHDIGLSGWWVLLPGLMLPLGGSQVNQWVIRGVAAAVFFVIAMLDGTRGANRFGPDPRGRTSSVSVTGTGSGLLHRIDRWTIVGLALTGALALFGIVAAGPAGKLVPRSWMQRAGEAELAAQVPEIYRCAAPAASAALERLATRLDPTLQVRIVFTSHPNVNGLAVPGGIVVVGQDVLRLAKSPAEVAGLMAHELAHVRLQHTEQMLAASLPLALLPRGMFSVLSTGLATSYSRGMEREADTVAMKTMSQAGVDPRQLAVLLKHIEEDKRIRRGRRDANVPSWLSTHPLTADRVEAIAHAHQATASHVIMSDQDWTAIQGGCIGSNLQPIRPSSGNVLP
ncbi:MAG: M48 family metalloprotease [Novosphingobium sp.]|nr:M48 family metalloprotease [Novosphingobium sp.]